MRKPNLLISLIPVVFLMGMLAYNIVVYGDSATSGANQLALLLAAFVAVGIGTLFYKQGYKEIEEQIIGSINVSMQASLILLMVGSLIGVWILSGIVPTMIYYGLKLIDPTIFLPVSCVVCAVVAVSTGSSWSTVGTVGIALIGIGKTLAIPEGMVAGAIISGAYFGDKLSPLSDTTNLAPAMAGTDLFTHIKHMLYTTVPAITLSIIGFFALNFMFDSQVVSPKEINNILDIINANFNIGLELFIVPALVLVLVLKKVPAFPAILIGTLLGAVAALIFQQELLTKLAADSSFYKVILSTAFDGFKIETGNSVIDSLFSRGGMASMLNTVWLILMAMVFGGAMEGTGMLEEIARSILKLVRGVGSLIGSTLASCIFLNMTASDQFLAIVVPGRMFKKAYDNFNLAPQNLSRALEDSGTVTSVLIPWNTCGAYFSGVLGVSTLTYMPYCFFNLLSPIISAFLGGFNIGITAKSEEIKEQSPSVKPEVSAPDKGMLKSEA